jgi:predicted enzyme related to lactoylglutathione lyase
MLKKIESIIFTSDKHGEAISFFEEKLGFNKPSQSQNMARFELAGFPIFIARSEKGSGAFISIETNDIESDSRILKERGVEILEPISSLKGGDKAAFFKGPVNIDFMLYQPAAETEELSS